MIGQRVDPKLRIQGKPSSGLLPMLRLILGNVALRIRALWFTIQTVCVTNQPDNKIPFEAPLI